MTMPRVRAIALYLPQFHPIPENDEWWGKGFTEWTNVARAKRLFPGHYQPHVPADLGFYDLRVEETRIAQADLARRYGIEGFCYYHYWFGNGRQLLERPFAGVLESGKPDFPFCLAWANQSWQGIWHGLKDRRVLVEQTYPGDDDHQRHFAALLPAFSDPRYIRVEGKPLFVIYDPRDLPDAPRTLGLWRTMAEKAGLGGLFLLAEHANPAWPAKDQGYDAIINTSYLPKRRKWVSWREPKEKALGKILDLFRLPSIVRYGSLARYFVPEVSNGAYCFPCVVPNWDNTPRAGSEGLVLHDSSPELFGAQVRLAVTRLLPNVPERRIMFVKSWNEWAEGNHLEPDLRFGHGYLDALWREIR